MSAPSTLWNRIGGQPRAVELLRRAADRPLHAYLLVGPAGCGVEDAARCFAAELVCERGGCGDCSGCRRVLRGRHPDVIEVEPDGQVIRVDQVEDIIEASYLAPAEAARKVIVVYEVERLNESAAGKLLKTLEEPPPRTHFVLVTGAAEELVETIVSRCQSVPFVALRDADVVDALVTAGLDHADATRAARLSGGRVDRARRLAGDWGALRRSVIGAVRRLDGTGAAVAAAADEIDAAIAAALAALEQEHAAELAALDDELRASGLADRAANALRKRMRERHHRVERRSRTQLVAEVITAVESVYRDALVAPAPPLDDHTGAVRVPLEACLAALDACRDAQRPLSDRNLTVNDSLLIERLLLHLPPVALVASP